MEINVGFGVEDTIALHDGDATSCLAKINSYTDGWKERLDPLSKPGRQQCGTR